MVTLCGDDPGRVLPSGRRRLSGGKQMATYIVTGCYTAAAMKGMIAAPSDREAAARGIIEASGGKLVSFLLTTGDTDFSLVVQSPDINRMLASLIAAAASGAVSNLKTVQAFTSAEFTAAQRAAGEIAAQYKAPS